MSNIKKLLNKYEKPYVKGEQRTNESKNNIKKESKRKNRQLILDELLLESKTLLLNKDQIQIVRFLIDTFNNTFKELHHQAKEETIILAFIFYVKKIETPSIRLDRYTIFKKYGLTDPIFEIIICRLLLDFMKKTPITPRDSNKSNHDLLVRRGLR